ncbi:hypothetical protein A4A49_65486, partial [Nicotiana attenuata]
IPSINKVYAMIISEESRRSMCHSSQVSEVTEGTALFSSKTQACQITQLRSKKNTLYYDYCNFKGHTRETCYKQNGYPPEFKTKKKAGSGNAAHFAQEATRPTGNNQTYTTTNFAGTSQVQHSAMPGQRTQNVMLNVPQFTQEQYHQIIQLLRKGSEGNNSTTPLLTGIASCVVTHEVLAKWIVDSGASSHVVHSLGLLVNPKILTDSKNGTIQLPTGN